MLLQDRRARCITCVPDGAWKIFPEEVVTLFIPIYRIHADKSIDLIRSRVERQIGRWKMGNWYSGHYDFGKQWTSGEEDASDITHTLFGSGKDTTIMFRGRKDILGPCY